jgi:hypothetical protein
LDTVFASNNKLPAYTIPPVRLNLFDGTCNSTISQAIDVPIRFPTGDVIPITFFITQLDSSCAVVLGHNWLPHYNPLIDWAKNLLTFLTPVENSPEPTSEASFIEEVPSEETSPLTDETPTPPTPTDTPCTTPPPLISFVNAATFLRTSKLPGTQTFRLMLSDLDAAARTSTVSDEPPDLSAIPEEYHDYADVFSEAKANNLAPHRPYDLKINLEEGTTPPHGPMYSLSQLELETLREFLKEKVSIGFIRPT